MSVMIRGQGRTRLKVMGDVEADLAVPADSAGRCWLSFSDGTLIEAAYGEDDDCRRCQPDDLSRPAIGKRIENISGQQWIGRCGAGNNGHQ